MPVRRRASGPSTICMAAKSAAIPTPLVPTPARSRRPTNRLTLKRPANPPPVVRDDGPETYTVQPNDNYWIISQKVYGTGASSRPSRSTTAKSTPIPTSCAVVDVVQTPRIGVLQENIRTSAQQRQAQPRRAPHSR